MQPGRADDDYERAYMTHGNVRFRDKLVASKLFHALMGRSGVGLIGAAVAAWGANGDTLAAGVFLAGAAASVGTWGLFSGLRITVTDDNIIVQYGLLGPTIPLESIESIESVDYHWTRAGGFGIRLGMDGSIVYNMMGDRGKAVKIVWRNKYGIKRKHVLSSTNPDAMVNAIEAARCARAGSEHESTNHAPIDDTLGTLRSAHLGQAPPIDLFQKEGRTESEQEHTEHAEQEKQV